MAVEQISTKVLLRLARPRALFLVDVREADEYASGHIKDAVNVPLSDIERISSVVADRTVPLFLYCASGARSARAEKALKQMGYTNIHNIGGIRGYAGPLE